MKHYLYWSVVLGTILHLLGFGAAFTHAVGSLLAIMLIIGAMEMMLHKKTLGQAAGPAIGGAFAVSFIPPFIATILRDLWATHPVLLVVIGVVALAVWTNGFRRFRPRSSGQGDRSGGGRAVSVPRRWRQ